MYQRSVKFPGHTTVLIAASAAGNVLPPLTLFEGSCPAIIQDVPEQNKFAATESGLINRDLLQAWFQEVFVSNCQHITMSVLLVMDYHS